MVKKGCFLALILIVFSAYFVSGQEPEFTHVISNSEDWRDVYSIVHYANLNGVGSDFFVSTRHGSLLMPGLSRSLDVRVVTSRSRPFVLDYPRTLTDNGFADADEVEVRDANLELIEDLEDIKDFIIVGNTYGYSSIAVVPYAVHKRAWVFFADRTNIDEIEFILENRDVDSVLIYGFVERQVRDALEKYDPEIIDNGDRFKDNVDIVEKYLEIRPRNQVSLTNGEFIEKGLMSGFDPILFTGKENVPDQISDYLKRSDFSVGVLVGSDLVGAATNIRRSTGISVIVKFAQGARNPQGPIAAVEGLDLYYLPIPVLELQLHSARYNRAISQLELTYQSNSNIPIFFRGTLTPRDENGAGTRFGDVEAVFIAPQDFKTVTYQDIDLVGDDLSIDVFTVYGDAPSSLERILEGTLNIELADFIDGCEIEIDKVTYSIPKESFFVKVSNLADVECFVDIEISELIVDGRETTIGSVGSEKIKPGKSEKIQIEQELSDEDLEDNDLVNIVAYYGEREDNLVKILQGKFKFNIQRISGLTILIILAIIIILILIIFLLWRRRKDKEDHYW